MTTSNQKHHSGLAPGLRLWITGSNGLLGQRLIQALCKRNTRVECLATSRGPQRGFRAPFVRYESLDIGHKDALKAFVERHRPEALIHTAAMTKVDECEVNPEVCRLYNQEAVQWISELCAQYGIYMLHISTDFVFPGREAPYDEEATPAPVNVYGHAKWQSEQIMQSILPKSVIFRTSLMYGYAPAASRENVVLWLVNALSRGEKLRMAVDQWRCPAWADEFAEACLTAIERRPEGIFNVCGANCLSPYEMAHQVAEVWDLDAKNIEPTSMHKLSQVARRPTRIHLKWDKARTQLNCTFPVFIDSLVRFKAQMDAE